jgi:hypothetical protein
LPRLGSELTELKSPSIFRSADSPHVVFGSGEASFVLMMFSGIKFKIPLEPSHPNVKWYRIDQCNQHLYEIARPNEDA